MKKLSFIIAVIFIFSVLNIAVVSAVPADADVTVTVDGTVKNIGVVNSIEAKNSSGEVVTPTENGLPMGTNAYVTFKVIAPKAGSWELVSRGVTRTENYLISFEVNGLKSAPVAMGTTADYLGASIKETRLGTINLNEGDNTVTIRKHNQGDGTFFGIGLRYAGDAKDEPIWLGVDAASSGVSTATVPPVADDASFGYRVITSTGTGSDVQTFDNIQIPKAGAYKVVIFNGCTDADGNSIISIKKDSESEYTQVLKGFWYRNDTSYYATTPKTLGTINLDAGTVSLQIKHSRNSYFAGLSLQRVGNKTNADDESFVLPDGDTLLHSSAGATDKRDQDDGIDGYTLYATSYHKTFKLYVQEEGWYDVSAVHLLSRQATLTATVKGAKTTAYTLGTLPGGEGSEIYSFDKAGRVYLPAGSSSIEFRVNAHKNFSHFVLRRTADIRIDGKDAETTTGTKKDKSTVASKDVPPLGETTVALALGQNAVYTVNTDEAGTYNLRVNFSGSPARRNVTVSCGNYEKTFKFSGANCGAFEVLSVDDLRLAKGENTITITYTSGDNVDTTKEKSIRIDDIEVSRGVVQLLSNGNAVDEFNSGVMSVRIDPTGLFLNETGYALAAFYDADTKQMLAVTRGDKIIGSEAFELNWISQYTYDSNINYKVKAFLWNENLVGNCWQLTK